MKADQANVKRTGPRPTWRRWRYVIDRRFQCKFALSVGSLVAFGALVVGFSLYSVFRGQAWMWSSDATVSQIGWGMALLGCAIAFALVICSAIAIWCLRVTHAICGPAFILERYFAELADGRLPYIREVRRWDEFKDLHHSFQQAVKTLELLRQTQMAGLDQAADFAREVSLRAPAELKADMASLRAQIDTLLAAEARFLGRPLDSDVRQGAPSNDGNLAGEDDGRDTTRVTQPPV